MKYADRFSSRSIRHVRFRAVLVLLSFGCAFATKVRADVELIVGNINGTRGGTIAVPIQLIGTTNIVGAQFDLIFPATQILSGYPFTGSSTNGPSVLSAELTNGIRRVVVYTRTNSILTNGVLVYFPLTIKTNTPNNVSSLYISGITLARADGTKEPLVFVGDGSLTVGPAAPASLGSIIRLGDGTLKFQVAGSDGAAYTIQASTNLTDWTSVRTFLTSGGLIDFQYTAGTNSRQFFRALGN